MNRTVLAASLMIVSFTALAGKEEREYMTKEMEPAVHEAEAKVKESCGCALKITVDQSIKSKDEMGKAKSTAKSVTEGAPKYCTDAASKKAICQMKSLTITKAATAEFTFKAGKGVVTTDGSSYVYWDMITRELDK